MSLNDLCAKPGVGGDVRIREQSVVGSSRDDVDAGAGKFLSDPVDHFLVALLPYRKKRSLAE